MKRARQEGMEEGIEEGIEKGKRETLLETIRNLMINMAWTAEQAMSAVSIPADNWDFYKAKL